MAVKDYTQTKDGIELQFGANHVGHFLLTSLLASKIIAAKGRILNVSSFGYLSGGVRFDDANFSVSFLIQYLTARREY
jgi:NAD(P)-dependent dehydrogenase (short-subunit alcohol dehydrogenase family)